MLDTTDVTLDSRADGSENGEGPASQESSEGSDTSDETTQNSEENGNSDEGDEGDEGDDGDERDTADNDTGANPSAQATSEAVKSLLGRSARALAALASGSDWQANRRRKQLGDASGSGGTGKPKWSGNRLGYGSAMKLGAVQTGDDNAVSGAPKYDVWARVGGLYYTDKRLGDSDGRAGVVYLGADYVVNPTLLVGVHGQIDFTDDDERDINLNSDTLGWMVGPYISVGLAPNVYFDARASFGLGKTDLEFSGGSEDSFDSRRSLLSASLSGDWTIRDYLLRTSAEILYLRLLQEQYTDGNGAVIGEQSVTLGRATVGAELARAYQLENNSVLEPYIGLKGVWDFKSSDERINSGQLFGGDGLFGRVEAGATFIAASGTTVRAKAAYEGFGANDYHAVQGSVTVIVPFN
ncbi:MAG: autotransporter outer membrane beta-barrel domain-containing protein [Hyphomicrobiaceae bacterium]